MIDTNILQTSLLADPQEKYTIFNKVPKKSNPKKLFIKSCPNTFIYQLSKTWDKGSRVVRERILKEFIAKMAHATGPQLEREMNNGASLFLTRISAWLRLTYLLGYDLSLQLKALGIFVSAASGNRFLTEFLEVGGILTVLEILTVPQAKEGHRAEALQLLSKVAGNGRKYKEFICESYGVRQITECLSKSNSERTQDCARNLLVSLGTGNPKFQMQVMKGLQTLISSSAVSTTSQQMSAQALRILLTTADAFPAGLIDASASLLRSQHMQVQYEGYELLKELLQRPACQGAILVILISILRMVYESTSDSEEKSPKDAARAGVTPNIANWNVTAVSAAEEQRENERLLSGYIQQTYASRLIGLLIAASDELAEKLISLQLVSALLNVIANILHTESQRHAAENLLYLVNRFDYVASALRASMGQNFFDLIENKPDTFYKDLTKEQIRYLRRSSIKIRNTNNSKDEKENKVGSDKDSDTDSADEHERTRLFTAFPGAAEATGEVGEKKSAETKENTTIEGSAIKSATASPNAVQDIKIQEQIILDSYEKSATQNVSKRVVEDVYTQYHQSGIVSTYPGSKYINTNAQKERALFEKDLENFRTKNNKKIESKKGFEPDFTAETSDRLQELRQDASLFSHEKVITDIEKHVGNSENQMMTAEELMRFEKSNEDRSSELEEELSFIEPEEERVLNAEEILEIEANNAYSQSGGHNGQTGLEGVEEWKIELNKPIPGELENESVIKDL